MSDFWELWQPKVGDRVKVRLSGECDFRRTVHAQSDPQRRFTIPHFQQTDGEIGVVLLVKATSRHRWSHPYFVGLNSLIGRVVPAGDAFAAIELEPAL
jgi:hypothetical protein